MPFFSHKIRVITEYINIRYVSPLTLNEAALLVNLNPKYLSRRFKKEAGIGFHDYCLLVQIHKAFPLLRDPSKSIKEISYAVGFSRPEIFFKTFKRFTGIQPQTYRKNILLTVPPLQQIRVKNSLVHIESLFGKCY